MTSSEEERTFPSHFGGAEERDLPRSAPGKLNVLVTNDDGVDSPGLWTLVEAVAPVADALYVVAPSDNQTAVGAGLTLRRELHWEQMESPVAGADAWHLDGTPADCVIIALRQIVKHHIDLVVSGINQGANMGNDILSSGTVGGALQAHFRGITSVAFSQVMEHGNEIDWAPARRIAATICRAEAERELPSSVFLNVNIPRSPYDELAGILVTRVGRSGFMQLAERTRQSGVIDKQVSIGHTNPALPPGTDVWAVAQNFVSVSPLQSNMTDHRLIDTLGTTLNKAFRE